MGLDAPNIQALWGDLIVEELVRHGVRTFVVAPGSRSTPLVQAVARNPLAHGVVWFDERGAAYRALGEGRTPKGPAAVVTTSGTAVANLLPAVVEASQDGVPLVLLTADRPPELRDVGANQSIRQVGIFSGSVRWSFDLPVPDDRLPARTVLTAVDHAMARAWDYGQPGPVQLNCPFREPLAPEPQPWDRACLEGLERWAEGVDPFTAVVDYERVAGALEEVAAEARRTAHGLVVAGTQPNWADAEHVVALARALGWPLWADVRSGLRLGVPLPQHLAHLDRLLGRPGGYAPRMVIQLGGRLTSKPLQAWLDGGHARRYVLVDADLSRLDPGHRVTHREVADIGYWCVEMLDALERGERPPAALPESLLEAEARVEAALRRAIDEHEALSEPWVARWLSRHVDPGHALFVSNSLPIRDLQRYAVTDGPAVLVGANRGASGIDGVLSTAAGFAEGRGSPTTLLIGDIALWHDVNALAHLAACEQPLTVVVLNNGGGSIFSFLPVARHEEVLTPLVATPHDLDFAGVCASFGLPHARVADRSAFEQAYREAAASGKPALVEVASSLEGNLAEHERIEAAIEAAIG